MNKNPMSSLRMPEMGSPSELAALEPEKNKPCKPIRPNERATPPSPAGLGYLDRKMNFKPTPKAAPTAK